MGENFKYSLVVMLIIAAIVTLSPVLASDVNLLDALDITPFSEDTVVTIDGIDFNIPKGYGEKSAKDNEIDKVKGVDFITFQRDYMNNDADLISISVFYDSAKSTNDITPHEGEVKKTIDGVDGVLLKEDGFVSFSYCLDGKTIMISAKDETQIADIIM